MDLAGFYRDTAAGTKLSSLESQNISWFEDSPAAS